MLLGGAGHGRSVQGERGARTNATAIKVGDHAVECHKKTLSVRDDHISVDHAHIMGVTPLLIACSKGHSEVVTALLAANASVDQPSNNGVTPLFIACQNGHT